MVNLLTIRKKKGLSQKEIAKRINISESYYCLIEKSERRPSPSVAIKLAKLLGFDWRVFYEDSGEKIHER